MRLFAETSWAIRLSNQHGKLKVHHIKSETLIKQALMKYRQSSIYLLHMAQAKSTFNFIIQKYLIYAFLHMSI